MENSVISGGNTTPASKSPAVSHLSAVKSDNRKPADHASGKLAKQADEAPVKIVTFYHFTNFDDFEAWQSPLRKLMHQHAVHGTILLAPEGVNATIAGPESGVDAVLASLKADDRFADLFVKQSWHHTMPFTKGKVRLKRETITLGEPTDAACVTGEQVSPEDWNKLLEDPEVLVLDTRNLYETHLGSFQGATIWPLDDFQEIVDKIRAEIDKKQKVAMFCTGGVRCEKLSSWMMLEGYENLYQLEGGIIHYLNQIPAEKSKWEGSCFVFDERVALTHGSQPAADVTMCPACGHPLTAEDRKHPHYIPAHHCGFCARLD
jgi:UPF0176 protein